MAGRFASEKAAYGWRCMVHQRLKGLFSVYEKSYPDAVESGRLSLGNWQPAVFSQY